MVRAAGAPGDGAAPTTQPATTNSGRAGSMAAAGVRKWEGPCESAGGAGECVGGKEARPGVKEGRSGSGGGGEKKRGTHARRVPKKVGPGVRTSCEG